MKEAGSRVQSSLCEQKHSRNTLSRLASLESDIIKFKTVYFRLKQIDFSETKSESLYQCRNRNDHLLRVILVAKPVTTNFILYISLFGLWENGKDVKENFKEVFDATQYTQALDIIHKYRQNQK